ncbi:MAG: indole-3-glycerol phosphate synthase TrpC [Nitrospirota bacterium]|jgi:indole-3-glycerol phosphate synthase
MSILGAIVDKKRERLALAKSRTPLGDLKARAADAGAPRDFARAVRRAGGGPIRLIAEIKRASPSRGPIREDYRPADIASVYAAGGADAISVITEEDFFLGSLHDLGEARGAAPLPVLRKDFVVDEYQLYESRAAGADAVLLIEDVLEQGQAADYLALAGELGMAVLFEVRDERSLKTALDIGAPIIGINNRDLRTFKIDLSTTLRLKEMARGEGRTWVSESGIERRSDVQRLEEAGVDAMLVGTAFMEASDIAGKLRELLGR